MNIIYSKRLDNSGVLTRIEKAGKLLPGGIAVSKAEYCCLNCALKMLNDGYSLSELSASDWGLSGG